MSFRRKGTETPRDTPCWCGAEVWVTEGLDTDGVPYRYESCTNDIFHDVSPK